MFGSVHFSVSFKMPSRHCVSNTSGDYLRLEGNKGWKICPASGDLTNQICPGVAMLGVD